MNQAYAKADQRCFNVFMTRGLKGHKPIVVVESIQEKAYNGIKLTRISVPIDNEYQDKKLNNGCQSYSIDPIQERKDGNCHVEMFQLLKKVASMRNIKDNKTQRPMKDRFLALEVLDYIFHMTLFKAIEWIL